MFETVAIVLSVVLLLAPVGIAIGYRIYTPEQRARANRLWRWYVSGLLLECVIGLCTLLWLLTRGLPTTWLVTVLTAVPLPVLLVQWRMHDRMGYTGWGSAWLARRVS